MQQPRPPHNPKTPMECRSKWDYLLSDIEKGYFINLVGEEVFKEVMSNDFIQFGAKYKLKKTITNVFNLIAKLKNDNIQQHHCH